MTTCPLRNKVLSNQYVQMAAQKLNTQPSTIVTVGLIVLTFLLDLTFIGTAFNNIVCLATPIRDALLLLKSQNFNVKDARKIIVVMTAFCIICVTEPIMKRMIPMYSLVKVGFMIAIYMNANLLNSTGDLLSKIPVAEETTGVKISEAAANASKAAEKKAEELKKTVTSKVNEVAEEVKKTE